MLWLQPKLRELQTEVRPMSSMCGKELDLAKGLQKVWCANYAGGRRCGVEAVAHEIRSNGMTQEGEGGKAYGKMSA